MRKAIALCLCVLASGASAQQPVDRDWVVKGGDLKISSPCVRRLSIQPATDLKGKIAVTATAMRQQELDQVSVTGGETVEIASADTTCPDSTVQMTIEVAPGTAIEVKENGRGTYLIGPVGGRLAVDLLGGATIEAAEVTDLDASLAASGTLRITTLSGGLTAKLSGSGDLAIGFATSVRSDVTTSGTAGLKVKLGTLGDLTLVSQGSGDLVIPALSGLHYEASGSGKLYVWAPDAESAQVKLGGSGDVRFGRGHIGSLTLAATGSATVRIDSTVVDADLSTRGAGDIELLEVTGQLRQSAKGLGHITVHERPVASSAK